MCWCSSHDANDSDEDNDSVQGVAPTLDPSALADPNKEDSHRTKPSGSASSGRGGHLSSGAHGAHPLHSVIHGLGYRVWV